MSGFPLRLTRSGEVGRIQIIFLFCRLGDGSLVAIWSFASLLPLLTPLVTGPWFFSCNLSPVIGVGLASWGILFILQATRMAWDLSQDNDSNSISRSQGGITEKEASSIGKFYLKMRPLQRKPGWRKIYPRQHLHLDPAMPEAYIALEPAWCRVLSLL